MPPTRLIYVSTRVDRTAEAIDAIFEVSERWNSRDDITGALLVGDKYFLQVLEGRRHLVSQCMMRIARDPRHTDVEIVSTNLLPHRLFATWSLYRIDAAALRKSVIKPFLLDGVFQPKALSQAGIEDLCRVLSAEARHTGPQHRRKVLRDV